MNRNANYESDDSRGKDAKARPKRDLERLFGVQGADIRCGSSEHDNAEEHRRGDEHQLEYRAAFAHVEKFEREHDDEDDDGEPRCKGDGVLHISAEKVRALDADENSDRKEHDGERDDQPEQYVAEPVFRVRSPDVFVQVSIVRFGDVRGEQIEKHKTSFVSAETTLKNGAPRKKGRAESVFDYLPFRYYPVRFKGYDLSFLQHPRRIQLFNVCIIV